MHLEITDAERRILLAGLAVRSSRINGEIADEMAEPDSCEDIVRTLEISLHDSDALYARLRNLPKEEIQP